MRISKSSKNTPDSSNHNINLPQEPNVCYEGERLACLLKSIERELELARLSDTALPEKIWFKQQFSIGVNDVTRVLERMVPSSEMERSCVQQPPQTIKNPNNIGKVASVELQAILVAGDCNPRWLTKHLSGLALSRKVPLIFVKDKKGGSLRLGQLVKLKTAIAIGVKVKENAVNEVIKEILRENESDLDKND